MTPIATDSCKAAIPHVAVGLRVASFLAAAAAVLVTGCAGSSTEQERGGSQPTARLSVAEPEMLNIATAADCGDYRQEDLREPAKVHPIDGVLETQLIVAMKSRCVPVFVEGQGWTMQRLQLRTYGYPKDHSDEITADEVQASLDNENFVWSAPGPTFVLDKATAPGRNDGTNFKMTLYNALDPQQDPHACDELERKPPRPQGPFQPDTAPNCFHGDNSTNFHFHGFHVSPQPHQDFVLLELLPFGSAMPESSLHDRGTMEIGEYPYDIDPLRYTQAEGTHWYHAHKHGSTALQVLNGLVGTFEIRGAFDTELEALFADQGGLPDRLMVVQQLQEKQTGLGLEPSGVPDPLVNGMANPIVRMRPGEIQRWRFVGATMQGSGELEIGFPQGQGTDALASPEVRQIAMDGVQFAPTNYRCQPIFNGPDCSAGTADDAHKDLNSIVLPPGTRIDLLVKAPDTPGTHSFTYEVVGNLNEEVADDLAVLTRAKLQAAVSDFQESAGPAATATKPPLLTVVVEAGDPLGSEFPTEAQFPRLPSYLDDLEGPFKPRTVAYEMANQFELGDVTFSICGRPYDPSCVNQTLQLDVPEEWTLTNNSTIAHPFHIHTNPFQLVSDNLGAYEPPYVWRDTLPIPTGTPATPGKAVIRYEAVEFTGEFVNHCHILGHEDRGMMHNVQAVCENEQWGKPTSDLSPECREGNYQPAAPKCPAGTCSST